MCSARNAGAASFRCQRSLKECLREARERIRQTRQRLAREGGRATRRMHAARLEVARDRMKRVKKARRHVEGQAIVGVQGTNEGNDPSQMEPMLAEIGRRAAERPKEHLVDGGFVKLESIEKAAGCGVEVFSPLQEARRGDIDATRPRKNDGPGVAAWRERMGTERARKIDEERAATAERRSRARARAEQRAGARDRKGPVRGAVVGHHLRPTAMGGVRDMTWQPRTQGLSAASSDLERRGGELLPARMSALSSGDR